MRHHISLLVWLIIIVSPTLSAPLFQDDNTLGMEEEVYLSFRYGGVIDEVVVAYYDGNNFYLPIAELFEYFYIQYDLVPAQYAIVGTWIDGNTSFHLNFNSRQVQFGDRQIDLTADDFLIKEVDFYLKPYLFKEIFGLDLQVDLSRLVIRLETTVKLPVVERFERRKKQLRLSAIEDETEELPVLSKRDRSWANGAMLDYNIQAAVAGTNRSVNLFSSAGGELLFGDVQGGIQGALGTESSDVSFSGWRYRYYREINPWFTSMSLGQVSGAGLKSYQYLGAAVTNNPVTPQKSYSNYVIDGVTDVEAEVELFQNNRLVQTATADDAGYYRFMVPLDYGTSDYKIRIYGKQGRMIDIDRRIQVPFTFLKEKDFRYHIHTGRLSNSFQSWSERQDLIIANASYGFTNWLTSSLGVEHVSQDSLTTTPVYFAQTSARLPSGILLGLDLASQSFSKLSARGFGGNASSWSVEHLLYNGVSRYNVSGIKQSLSYSHFKPFQALGTRFTARGNFGWQQDSTQNHLNYAVSINQIHGALRLQYGYEGDHAFGSSRSYTGEFDGSIVYSIPRTSRYHKLLRGTYLRGDVSLDVFQSKLSNVRFQMFKQLSHQLKLNINVGRDLRYSNTKAEVGVSLDLDAFKSTTRVRSISNTTSFTQTLRGSIGWDSNNGDFIFDSRQHVGRSGLSVLMFVDADGSGYWSEGEQKIPGNAVSIIKSSTRKVTRNGVVRLTQLQPYRSYDFYVNEALLRNPSIVPAIRKFSLTTDPNRYKQIEVPFYTIGVIDGRVDRIREGEFIPISGLKIHIVSEEGEYDTILRTYADGSFYSMDIPPGDYEAYIDETQLEFLGMESVPERHYFTIEVKEDGDYVENLNFLLE